jgi:hypothetical protein
MNKEQDIPCYLCKLRGFHSKTQFGCAGCRVGFHIECFTAFHCKDGLKGNMKTLLDMIKASEIAGKNHRKKSTYVGSLESLQLPSPPMKNREHESLFMQSNSDASEDASSHDESSHE